MHREPFTPTDRAAFIACFTINAYVISFSSTFHTSVGPVVNETAGQQTLQNEPFFHTAGRNLYSLL